MKNLQTIIGKVADLEAATSRLGQAETRLSHKTRDLDEDMAGTMAKFRKDTVAHVDELIESAVMEVQSMAEGIQHAVKTDDLDKNITKKCKGMIEEQEVIMTDIVTLLKKYIWELNGRLGGISNVKEECDKLEKQIKSVPEWAESMYKAVRNLDWVHPQVESLRREVDSLTIKADLAQEYNKGCSQVSRPIKQDGSGASTSSWEQIRAESVGSPPARSSMLPDSILHWTFTQNRPWIQCHYGH